MPISRMQTAVEHFPSWIDRHRYTLLISVALLYLLACNGQWRLGPDTALYATIGHHLAAGWGYTHPLAGQGMANPGLPLLIALNFWLFGFPTMWPMVLLLCLMGLSILALTYQWVRLYDSRAAATMVTCLLGVNVTMFRLTLEVLTDIPFLLGLMLFLVGYGRLEKKVGKAGWGWGLIFVGLTIMALFRLVVLVVVGAILAVALVRAVRERRLWYVVLAALALAVPLVLQTVDPRLSAATGLTPKQNEIIVKLFETLPQTLKHAVTTNIPNLLLNEGPMAIFGNKLALAPVTGLVTLVALGMAIGMGRRQFLWGVLVSLFLLQWALFLPDYRYFLPILPIIAYGWWRGSRWVALLRWRGQVGTYLALVMLALWLGMNTGRTLGFVFAQRSSTPAKHYEGGRYVGISALGSALPGLVEPQAWVLVNAKWCGPLCFYSDRRVATAAQVPVDVDPRHDHVYAVEPLDAQGLDLLHTRHWTLGATVFTLDRGRQCSRLVLRRVTAPLTDTTSGK